MAGNDNDNYAKPNDKDEAKAKVSSTIVTVDKDDCQSKLYLERKERILKQRVDAINHDKKKHNVSTMKNELTKLIPGYKAPLCLSAVSTSGHESSNYNQSKRIVNAYDGLEELRRKALHTEQSGAKKILPSTGTTMSKISETKITGSYSTAITSFKTGHKQKRKVKTDAGAGWFHMQPTVMTDDVKRDITLIRNRNYLDPKKFYKSTDPLSQYIQVGTVIEGPTEYYSSRLTKKQRQNNLTEEIMADSTLYDYTKRKSADIQRVKQQAAMKRKSKKRGKKAFKV